MDYLQSISQNIIKSKIWPSDMLFLKGKEKQSVIDQMYKH